MISLAAVIWAAGALSAAHSSEADLGKLDIGEVLIAEIEGPTTLRQMRTPLSKLPPGIVRLDRILNTAVELWEIIKENAPVADVKKQYASALPEGTFRWDQLEQWDPPTARKYRLGVKNLAGIEMATFEYLVIFQHGGRIQGRGRYLTGVTIEPVLVNVRWGYRLNVDAKAVEIVNLGTNADPVAGMTFVLNWKIETAIQKSAGTQSYFVDGAGGFRGLEQSAIQ